MLFHTESREVSETGHLCFPRASVVSFEVIFAMFAATIFSTTQRSTSDKSRRFASSWHWLLCAKVVFAISFLSTAAVPSRLATSIPSDAIQLNSPPSPSISLPVISFQYLTMYVSACDGQVSSGPSLGVERTPAALVALASSTRYNASIRWSSNQKRNSSCRFEPRPATTLTYPVATMRIYSPSLRTWQSGLLTRTGKLTLPSTSREPVRRSTSFHTKKHDRKSDCGMII